MDHHLMGSVDWIGYLGSACVLTAFSMKNLQALRLVSICGNCVFVAYACLAGVMPVLVMNLALLGLNIYRYVQTRRMASASGRGTNASNANPPANRAVSPVRVRHAMAPLVEA